MGLSLCFNLLIPTTEGLIKVDKIDKSCLFPFMLDLLSDSFSSKQEQPKFRGLQLVALQNRIHSVVYVPRT